MSGDGEVRGLQIDQRSAHRTVAGLIEPDDTTRARRVRSAGLLAVLVVVLGAVAAATFGVLAVGLTSLVDQALG